MKTLATALAGILGVCALSASPALANPYDPFGSNAGDDYGSDPAYAYGRATDDPYGYQGTVGQGVQAAPQAQVAPIPREIVAFNGSYKPGTIVVSTAERRLYFVMPNGEAIRYGAEEAFVELALTIDATELLVQRRIRLGYEAQAGS